MTACCLLDAGTPTFISDTLQSVPLQITVSPENQHFIEDLLSPSEILRVPLASKLLIHHDTAIALAGTRGAAERFARYYREENLRNCSPDEVVARIMEMRNAPYLGRSPSVLAAAPGREVYNINGSQVHGSVFPFRKAFLAGTGTFYLQKHLDNFSRTFVGKPWSDEDRTLKIHSAWGFALYLNARRLLIDEELLWLNYMSPPLGSTFGGFFQSIFFEPESFRWIRMPRFVLSKVGYEPQSGEFMNVRTFVNVSSPAGEQVCIYDQDDHGNARVVRFTIDDPFGSYDLVECVDQSEPRCCSVVANDLGQICNMWDSPEYQWEIDIMDNQVLHRPNDLMRDFFIERYFTSRTS